MSVGRAALDDDEVTAEHARSPLLYRGEHAARAPTSSPPPTACSSASTCAATNGGTVGYRAKQNTPAARRWRAIGTHHVRDFWEPVTSEDGDRIVLDPERFYLLLSEEAVQVPPDLAAEMTAFDPTSGELRTHYAGFFDPGFGYDRDGDAARLARRARGARPRRAVHDRARPAGVQAHLRAHARRPEKLYGAGIGSNYQGQVETLGKHFTRG